MAIKLIVTYKDVRHFCFFFCYQKIKGTSNDAFVSSAPTLAPTVQQTEPPAPTIVIPTETEAACTSPEDVGMFNQSLAKQSLLFQTNLMQLAEKEHHQRMKVLQVEQEVLLLKKRKLEMEIVNCQCKKRCL